MNDQIGQRIAGRARELLGVSEMSGPAGAIDLTVAGPDGPAEHVQSAAIAALERGETHYTDRQGILPLREKIACLLYTSPSPRDRPRSRMPSSA